jgi:hypothetical protein
MLNRRSGLLGWAVLIVAASGNDEPGLLQRLKSNSHEKWGGDVRHVRPSLVELSLSTPTQANVDAIVCQTKPSTFCEGERPPELAASLTISALS